MLERPQRSSAVRSFDDPPRDRNVLIERIMGCVDHNAGVEAALDTLVAGLFIAMVEMHRENRFGKHLFGRPNHGFEHSLVGILPGALRELNDKRRLASNIAAEQPEELFHVVNIVGSNGEFSVGDFVELGSGDDHLLWI